MSRALAWIRKSKGSDDDIGLEDQREMVHGLANEFDPDHDTLDLGVHTGFSSMTRDDPSGLLDQNKDVQETVERIRSGEWDRLIAFDDRRVCRDEYFSVIQYACKQGGCDIVYWADVDEDDLTFDLKRRIERDTKEEEIRKAKRAIKKKKERGDDLGRPKFGYTYNTAKTAQVPGDDFHTALRVISLRDDGATYREIESATGVGQGTISNILNRREQYLADADEHDIDTPALTP